MRDPLAFGVLAIDGEFDDVEALVTRKGEIIAKWGTQIQTVLTCKGLHDVKALVIEKERRET